MSAEDCKLPIGEDYKYLVNEQEKHKQNSNSHKILLVISGVLLIITMAVILGFTFRLASDMNQLRVDFEKLKTSIKNFESATDNYDDLLPPEPMESRTEAQILQKFNRGDASYENLDDYLYEDYIESIDDGDDDDNDDDNISDDLQTHKLYTGGQFTKDAKISLRTKRNVVGYTDDGVPINSESYAEARRRNLTSRKSHRSATASPTYLSSYHYQQQIRPGAPDYEEASWKPTSTPRPVYSRRSRVMLREDKSKAFRQIVKKSSLLKSGEQHRSSNEEDSEVEFTVVRNDRVRHRPNHIEVLDERHPRIGRMRPLPTAHFSGDTSKYVLGQHENFNGNGHLRHPQRTFVDWSESSWYRSLGMDRHFSFSDGFLTIKDSGIYFVYAQIYYLDEHDTNGFRVYKNEDTLLQCTTMTHSVDRVMKANTCFTAAAEYLEEGDRISLGDLSPSRYSLFEPGKSFFGVIKLGDVKVK